MPEIDGLLKFLKNQGADTLNLKNDTIPIILKEGSPIKHTIPPFPYDTLYTFIIEILDDTQKKEFATQHSVKLLYVFNSECSFNVTATIDSGNISLLFKGAPKKDLLDKSSTTSYDRVGIGPYSPSMNQDRPKYSRAILKLIELIQKAKYESATDIHLCHLQAPSFRINGELRHDLSEKIDVQGIINEIPNKNALDSINNNISVDFGSSLPDYGNIRFHIFQTIKGVSMSVRLLPDKIPTLLDLNMPRALANLTDFPHGLVLFTGPTGCGKTSTMAALLNLINMSKSVMILTLESPVEFIYKNNKAIIRQREIGTHVDNFVEGLRDALREDPDIILVGEMRDRETISLVLTAAETGHLVFSTLHTTTAPSAIDRIVDVFPSSQQSQIRIQLADCLRAVISQRLLPRKNQHGRVPAVEILYNTYGVGNCIRESKTAQIYSAMITGNKEGMITLDQSMANMVKKGIIDEKTAFAHSRHPNELKEYFT